MNTTSTGNKAEDAAVQYLKKKGYKVLARNWRRPKCEIDIVASLKKSRFSREKTIHFVEVKYRRNAEHGSGLDYITPAKLKQMEFAAKMWVAENSWEDDYELDAVAVSGKDFKVSQHIPNLDV